MSFLNAGGSGLSGGFVPAFARSTASLCTAFLALRSSRRSWRLTASRSASEDKSAAASHVASEYPRPFHFTRYCVPSSSESDSSLEESSSSSSFPSSFFSSFFSSASSLSSAGRSSLESSTRSTTR